MPRSQVIDPNTLVVAEDDNEAIDATLLPPG